MSNSALEGVNVVEIGTMISAPYCTKMLGDLGADVIKVESPESDPARDYGPFPNGTADREKSALYLYLNTSKRGVTLDLSSSDDVEQLKKLIQWADVLVDNHSPKVLENLGLGWDALKSLNPGLVYTSITPYGRTGPMADAPGDELTLVHASGLGNLLPTRSENVNRAPVKPGGNMMGYHGGLAAAVAVSAALLSREKTGEGALIDVSLQETMLAMMGGAIAGARYHKSTWSRVPDRPPAMGRVQTSDGYVILNAMDDHHFALLRDLMGNPDWCAGDQWLSMSYRANNMMDIADKIDDWALQQKKEEIHFQIAEKRVPCGPINTAEEVMNYKQYEAREYFVDVEHPDAGKHRYAGWPYKLPASPPAIQSAAPRLGEHNDEILKGAGVVKSESKPNAGAKRTGKLPLEGIRVLEFAWVWAGPYCGMLLAQLGAEVIKVESHNRMDLMRRSVIWPLPEEAPSEVPSSEGIGFNSVNMNKKSVTIDMGSPEGLDLAKKMVSTADIIFDNMRPGALAKLGLGYDSASNLKEDIIVASSSGRGSVGPESQYLGYAMIHHAIGGNAYITGYPDEHPCHTTGDVDIMNATMLAYAILAAVHHRDRTGEGQFIDYSQTEAVSSLIGEVLLGYEMTGVNPERVGNQHHQYAPHNVYKAWGVNRWIAIEVHDDDQFKSLADAMGQPDLASDPKFATCEARKQNEQELDGIVEAWTSKRDRDRTTRLLISAGVAAAPSRDSRDLYADRHLQERGAFVKVDHPDLGELELISTPWKLDGLQVDAVRAPFLGEHSDEVIKDIVGLDDAGMKALRDSGIVQ